MKLNLQYFAEPASGAAEGEGNQNNQQQNNQQNNQPSQNFDYDKLASIIAGKQSVTEDTVLKNYFKQQGLSPEEMNQAITTFKEQKAKNTPDFDGMQSQLTQYQQEKQQLLLEKAATTQAIKSGISIDTVPYVLKMADLSKAVGTDGKIVDDEIKNAIDKVLEDVPQLKPSSESQNNANIKIGAPGNNSNSGNSEQDEALRQIFGIRKK